MVATGSDIVGGLSVIKRRSRDDFPTAALPNIITWNLAFALKVNIRCMSVLAALMDSTKHSSRPVYSWGMNLTEVHGRRARGSRSNSFPHNEKKNQNSWGMHFRVAFTQFWTWAQRVSFTMYNSNNLRNPGYAHGYGSTQTLHDSIRYRHNWVRFDEKNDIYRGQD